MYVFTGFSRCTMCCASNQTSRLSSSSSSPTRTARCASSSLWYYLFSFFFVFVLKSTMFLSFCPSSIRKQPLNVYIFSQVGPKPMMIKLHKDKRNSEESTLFLMVNENPRNRNVNHLASELQNRFFPASGLPQILGNAVLVRTVADEYLTEHRTVQKRETHGFTQNDKDFLYFTYSL